MKITALILASAITAARSGLRLIASPIAASPMLARLRTAECADSSVISFATSVARRMFSTRSASVKPRSRFSPWRTLSPSSM